MLHVAVVVEGVAPEDWDSPPYLRVVPVPRHRREHRPGPGEQEPPEHRVRPDAGVAGVHVVAVHEHEVPPVRLAVGEPGRFARLHVNAPRVAACGADAEVPVHLPHRAELHRQPEAEGLAAAEAHDELRRHPFAHGARRLHGDHPSGGHAAHVDPPVRHP